MMKNTETKIIAESIILNRERVELVMTLKYIIIGTITMALLTSNISLVSASIARDLTEALGTFHLENVLFFCDHQ
jgi:hypothetical protein